MAVLSEVCPDTEGQRLEVLEAAMRFLGANVAVRNVKKTVSVRPQVIRCAKKLSSLQTTKLIAW